MRLEPLSMNAMPLASQLDLDGMRFAQRAWAATAIRVRVSLVRQARQRFAAAATELAESVPNHLPGALHRTTADTLASEVLPLIEACRFLERQAAPILRTTSLGNAGRPFWLSGVDAEVERAPRGIVLVIGPSNYPLFLAGTQVLQALTAGNAVLWKPAPATESPARLVKAILVECGLDAKLLTILDSDAEAAQRAIQLGVDYVTLTGSANTGRAILRSLAETLTPSAMELSGCDAVYVLPGADQAQLIRALSFGLRFNGSFTCMAPRRMFLVGWSDAAASEVLGQLSATLAEIAPVSLNPHSSALLASLLEDAASQGAEILLDGRHRSTQPDQSAVCLVTDATPAMLLMKTEIFAPVLTVMRTIHLEEALAASAACPFALTASIFGPETQARGLASRLGVGNITINDIVVPSADPRIAFGGRGSSGFGVTRGTEGLLAMTTLRTIQIQKRPSPRTYEATGPGHVEFFSGLAALLHGRGLASRLSALRRVIGAARNLGQSR